MYYMQLPNLATSILLAGYAYAAHWQPAAGTTWQIVLSEQLKPPYPAGIQAIDGDLYVNSNSTWSDIRSRGIKTICYFSAGSYENWRPDANEFNNDTDIGAPLDGWPGEWWVNTKSENVRRIMKQRLDLAVQNGCDAVDPDNIDAYENDGGGLGLTEDDAVDYVTFLATEAHNRNMAVGLKNGGDIVDRVLDVVEFEVNEQCEQFDECDIVRPFIEANKPVFGIEYTKTDTTIPSDTVVSDICNNPTRKGFSTVIKHMNLDSWVVPCNITSASRSSNTTGAHNSSTSTSPTPTPDTSEARSSNTMGSFLFLIVGVTVAAGL